MSARETHKLGKLPASPAPSDLRLGRYLDHEAVLPKIPTVFGFGHGFGKRWAWLMLGNGPDDSVRRGFQGAGDCVLAGAGEETRVWTTARNGPGVTITGKESIADYSTLTGYVIGDDSTDQGTDMGAAADYRRKTGIRDASGARHKIAAYAYLEAGDFDQLRAATFVFGCAGVGIVFPDSAWDGFDLPVPTWDYVPGSPDDGGHYIPAVGSDSPDEITVVSWAERVRVTRAFIEHQEDEAIVYLSEEMIRSNGEGLHGFDLATFKTDLAAVTA